MAEMAQIAQIAEIAEMSIWVRSIRDPRASAGSPRCMYIYAPTRSDGPGTDKARRARAPGPGWLLHTPGLVPLLPGSFLQPRFFIWAIWAAQVCIWGMSRVLWSVGVLGEGTATVWATPPADPVAPWIWENGPIVGQIRGLWVFWRYKKVF